MTVHFQQIHTAIAKFEDSQKCLNYVDKRSGNKQVMVPLTSSLYVPGQLDESNNVMLEVGGGFFVEKDIPGATDYCQRKIDSLKESKEKVGQIIMGKRQNLQKVQKEYTARVTAMQEQMKAQQAK